MPMKVESVDFLVIGSGIAGLRAAVELASRGSVWVLTKDVPEESSSEYAQGGVAVALSDEDTIGIHFDDTIKAGDGLCDEAAVHALVEEGPERILELISWGAEFDKTVNKKLSFTLEAAHSRKRILHAHGDSTGRELIRVLLNKVKNLPNVSKYPFAYIIDLIVLDGRCYGAYVLKDGEFSAILSQSTLLATGGAGQVFSRTTNPLVATGDGQAVAYRAGAALADMEFVQFHPTSLFAPSAPQFLLSEALRGEGAKLRNIHKEEFMKIYHPDAELAPRDVVSRAIVSEMVRTNSSHVYLDITHLDRNFVKERFPRIYTTCLKYDVDITGELVPVSPAAHYMMGGVKTSVDGAASIAGLYAAGEVACTGVHGANRLASNSLLEGLVFGFRAARAAIVGRCEPPSIVRAALGIGRSVGKIENPHEVRGTLRKTMWNRAGIIRCNVSLTDAIDTLKIFEPLLDGVYRTRYENELKNMVQTSFLIVRSAMERKNSVGSHFRSDYPRGERAMNAVDAGGGTAEAE
jgi:L-aspartate oxidase